jgi:hypothetical protein
MTPVSPHQQARFVARAHDLDDEAAVGKERATRPGGRASINDRRLPSSVRRSTACSPFRHGRSTRRRQTAPIHPEDLPDISGGEYGRY